MYRNILFLVAFILAILGATYLLNKPQQQSVYKEVPIETVEILEDYPDIPFFKFNDLDGNTIKITEYEGKTVLLNFWASWCAPCVVEFPKLLELAAKRPEEVIILAISVDRFKTNVHEFFEKLDETSQESLKLENVVIGWDPQKQVSYDVFQTVLYPETYIIGPDQTLRLKIVGADTDFSSDAFIQRLSLFEQKPEAPEQPSKAP